MRNIQLNSVKLVLRESVERNYGGNDMIPLQELKRRKQVQFASGIGNVLSKNRLSYRFSAHNLDIVLDRLSDRKTKKR